MRFRSEMFRMRTLFYLMLKGLIVMDKVVFVGAGSMAEAIIAGIVNKSVMRAKDIYVMNKSDEDRLIYMQNTYGVSIVSAERNELSDAGLFILATKPKDIHQAMADIVNHMNDDAAALSVIAGVSIATIESGLGARPIARSMPNTSATIGKSATGVSMNQSVNNNMNKKIISLLSSIGIVKEVVEDELHLVTALSGSGPAYVYYLVEALEEAAISKGLCADTARELIIQTLEGAASMLKKTGEEPSILRKNVTSPGGTTEAGLRALEKNSFKQTISHCINDAEARSRELGIMTDPKIT